MMPAFEPADTSSILETERKSTPILMESDIPEDV